MGRARAMAVAGLVLASVAGGAPTATEPAADEPRVPLYPEAEAMYDDVLAILGDRGLPLCRGSEPGFRPAPPGQVSAPAAHFRYVDGRIHELGSCDLALDRRGELRIYHYQDQAARDEAARSSSQRSARPTVTWTHGEDFLIEQWVFATPEANPGFAQFTDTVHRTISELPEARHVETAPGA